MRGLWITIVLLLSCSARAAETFPEMLSKQTCSPQAQKILKEWHAQDAWTRAIGHKPNEEMFRTPTATVGKWVEVSALGNQLTLRLFNEKAVLSVEFDSKCKSQARMLAHKPKPRFKTPPRGYALLQDENVAHLLEQKKSGVIFLWSPHKQISVEGLKQILEAAKSTNTKVYPVADPDSDPKAVDRVAKELKLAKKDIYFLDSFDLQYRGFRLHHPSLIVFNDGKFTSQVRRGYEDAFIYKEYLQSHM